MARDYTPAVIRTREEAVRRLRDASVATPPDLDARAIVANSIAPEDWRGNRYALANEACIEVVRRGYETRFRSALIAAAKPCDVDTPERLALHLIAIGDALPEPV